MKMYPILLLCFVALFTSGDAIRCSQCEATAKGSDDESCVRYPPSATECANELHHCIAVAKYDYKGNLQAFTRSCSPIALPTACLPGVDRASGHAVQVCYSTCQKDGCNGSKSLHHLLELLRRRRSAE